MPDTLFKNIADAIRSRFGISGTITPLQFGNKINSGTPVMSLSTYDSYDVAFSKILENTADAVRSKGGTSGLITANNLPTAIRNIKILQYGGLTTASQSNVGWSVPSMPSIDTSRTSYSLTFSYSWSHSSYDSYKVNSVSITPGNTTILNPGYSGNIKSKPVGGNTYSSLSIRCSYTSTLNFSSLVGNPYLTDDEIYNIMYDELQSEINRFKSQKFSFSINYYPGTYV